jgi:hypothetical protein
MYREAAGSSPARETQYRYKTTQISRGEVIRIYTVDGGFLDVATTLGNFGKDVDRSVRNKLHFVRYDEGIVNLDNVTRVIDLEVHK